MGQQTIVQDWQPFFTTLAGASAALAGLVFVAMSLHPNEILRDALIRSRAFSAASGFLLAVVWAFAMLLPARIAPVGSYALVALGIGGFAFQIGLQLRVRKAGLRVVRALLGDVLILAPVPAGFLGFLSPDSQYPFEIIAAAATLGILILFAQSWELVVLSVTHPRERRGQEPPPVPTVPSPVF
jgi:hypothetical protein